MYGLLDLRRLVLLLLGILVGRARSSSHRAYAVPVAFDDLLAAKGDDCIGWFLGFELVSELLLKFVYVGHWFSYRGL